VKLLLDTHVWLWMALEPGRLQTSARAALLDADNELFVSAATIWEVAIKTDLGKLELPIALADLVATQTGPGVAESLSITAEHALTLAALPRHHRDPFDRMLVAQAKAEGMTLVTADEALRAYGVPILWAT
jgi:PIN domain nuclease of toxin-antitoxin system